MNAIVHSSEESKAEAKLIATPAVWFISYQNSDPMIGLYYDGVIGAYEMTQSRNNNVTKFHAMAMCSRTNTDDELRFDKERYHTREIISMFLPKINYQGRAKFYVPEFAPFIKYDETEINVKIERGNLVSGVLDKATIGQGTNGSIFHTIYSEKGASAALDTIYNLQQVINGFLYHRGVSFSLKDIYLSAGAREKLLYETKKIITDSEKVTEDLRAGKLVPPVEMSLRDYYEELQSSALEHGDEFIRPIMEDIDIRENNLYKLVFSGSKGDRSNLTSIYAAIGSIGLKGGRIPFTLNGRTSVNFQRYSTEAISRGYCPASFSTGIPAIIFPFAAMEARYELIEVSLSTAVAGQMNRNAVKNLESILVSNYRGSVKNTRVVQIIFGETGIDPRKVERVTFPSIKPGLEALEQQFRTRSKQLAKIWQNAGVQAALDNEYDVLRRERDEYRTIMLRIEASTRRNPPSMKDTARMPVNVQREIENVRQIAIEMRYRPEPLDPIEAIETVHKYVTDLGYVYMNRIQRDKRAPIPRHIEAAVTFLRILIRSWLCTSNLVRRELDNKMLGMVLDRVTLKISQCFIEYGTNIGIIAAESISEPITQHLLDAKHRAGLKKEKTNMVERFDEILKNKATEAMHNPNMILIPLPQYRDDRQRVMEIANYIEMLPLSRFIVSTRVFIENFQQPEHPDFKHESNMVKRFMSFSFGDTIPKDLISWCIRYELDKEELILKSMKMKTIYLRIMEMYPNLYVVYDPAPSDTKVFVMRIYMRNAMFKRADEVSEENILKISDMIGDSVIRGIPGITSANVTSIPYTRITETGEYDLPKMYAIETDGTNLSTILENQYLDVYECNTTSIQEIEQIYGIEAARNKIIDEFLTTEKQKANYEWASVYADEMTYNGLVTSIQRSGLSQRDLNNVLLRASFGFPIQVIQAAAINNQTDNIQGMSAPMCLGATPRFGTTYNDIAINHAHVNRMTRTNAEIIAEI